MQNHFMAKLIRLPHDCRAFLRVKKTGLFNAALYHAANPDVPSAPNKALWHFSRYFLREERVSGQNTLQDWLLEKICETRLSATTTRKLMRQLSYTDESEHGKIIAAFCKDNALSFQALQCRTAFLNRDLDSARDHLSRIESGTHDVEQLLLHYEFAKKIGIQPKIGDSFARGVKALERPGTVSLKFYRALHEVGYALGKSTDLMGKILQHMDRSNYRPIHSLREDLWVVGLAIGETESALGKQILSVLPQRLQTLLSQSLPFQHADIGNWQTALTVMSANMLELGRYYIKEQEGAWEIVEHTGTEATVAQIRMLPQTYWLGAQYNKECAPHLIAFKKSVRALAQNVSHFYPQPAGQIYDISRIRTEESFVLSYHSYATTTLKAIHIKESALPDLYTFDACGFSGWACPNFTDTSEEEAEIFFQALTAEFVSQNRSKYAQPETTHLPFDKGFVFVPLQVPNDSVMQHSRVDIFEALERLLSQKEMPYAVVVKPHPKDPSAFTRGKLNALGEKFPHLIISTHAIHDLLDATSLVITTNSGVGMETLLYLKPVLTLGRSDYEHVAHAVSQIETFLPTMDTAFKTAGTLRHHRKIKTFLLNFFAHNCYALNSDSMPPEFHTLAKTLLSEPSNVES